MVCYLGQQGLSRYHLTFKLHTVSINEGGGGGYGRSHFSDGFVSDTAYKPGDIKDGYSKRGAPRRSSDGPRRLANGAANPWNRLKRTRKWRPATAHAKDAARPPPPTGYAY